ncbi:MAG: DUF58 domain-containing protein [Jatrophihabitans sp.]|nr:MAG: DUF58 domain-containing protein [Jatrophihabitans sp.]
MPEVPSAPVADHGPSLPLDAGESLLRRLELAVRNKLDGLLQGNYQGLVPGPGSEAGESRPYVAGDDVRRMDWPVTARTLAPHVRQTIADRELETWLVVDLSPSMDFGTGLSEKRELVLAAITAVTHLTVRGGNRVGAIVGNGAQQYRIPARAGRAHARHLVRRIAATPRAGAGEQASPELLAQMLAGLGRPPRRRGMVAVVSDYLEVVPDGASEPLWARTLRGLGQRHQLLGIEVVDPRELELPALGLITFSDPETGRHLEVQTSSRRTREAYAVAAAHQRGAISAALRRAGAAHLQLRTDRDWIADVVRFVVGQRRFVAGVAGGR